MVDVDAFVTLQAQTNVLLLGISKMLDVRHMGINRVQNSFIICEHCVEPYPSDKCGSNPEVMNYINNKNHQGNSYLNTYIPS